MKGPHAMAKFTPFGPDDFEHIKRRMSRDLDDRILHGFDNSKADTLWSDEASSPWLDMQNAMRTMRGGEAIIDARFPVEGVYQITSL